MLIIKKIVTLYDFGGDQLFLICIRKKGGICKKCCFTVKGKCLVEYSYYNREDKETIKKTKDNFCCKQVNVFYCQFVMELNAKYRQLSGILFNKKDSGFEKYVTYDSEVTSTTVKGITTGKTYYFKVRGMKVENNANVYTKFSDVVSKKLKLNTPRNLYVARNTYNS